VWDDDESAGVGLTNLEQQPTPLAIPRGERPPIATDWPAERAAALAAGMLTADFSAVFADYMGGGPRLRMAAGVGWRKGWVGNYDLKLSYKSLADCAREMRWPVIVDDLTTETRMPPPRVLLEHRVRSGLSVLIPGSPQPHGALAVYTAAPRRFVRVEIDQLQAVADLLGAAADGYAAQQSPERAGAIMETSFDAIALATLDDLCLVDVNRAFEQLMQVARADLIGRSAPALGLVADPAGLALIVAAVRADGGVQARPMLLRTGSGRPMPALLTASAIEIGGRPGLALVLRDDSDRSRAAAELARAEVELATTRKAMLELAHLKSAFLANTSHEIRTPLNLILGYSDLIADHLAELGDDSQTPYFEAVQRAGRRLIGTIDGILDYARIESGALDLRPIDLALNPIVRRIAAELAPLAEAKGLALECALDEPGATVHFDRHCLEHAIAAVMHNAIKFTERGGVTVRVARSTSGALTLMVKDTGVGIEQTYLAHLFEPFSQEQSSPARRYEGAGLGLALTRRYLELNGATLKVASV
jgi:PAS domain S-box-containing protein